MTNPTKPTFNAYRFCAVKAAWDARKTSHDLRRRGCDVAADAAWRLVRIHLDINRRFAK